LRDITKFLDLLVSNNIGHQGDFHLLSQKFQGDILSLINHLISEGVATYQELGTHYGDFIGYPYIDLGKTLFQCHILERLPEKFARRNKILFIYQFGDAITAASADPRNRIVIEEAERISKRQISPVFAFPEEIEDAIDIHYSTSDSVKELYGKIDIDKLIEESKEVSLEALQKIAGDKAIIEFGRGLMLLAIKEQASDIHIEPGENSVRVRFRIDGVLQDRLKLDKSLLEPLVSRVKLVAGADIIEKRRPQDGRISFPLSNRSIDFRFSIIPTIYGEKIALRILGHIQSREVETPI